MDFTLQRKLCFIRTMKIDFCQSKTFIEREFHKNMIFARIWKFFITLEYEVPQKYYFLIKFKQSRFTKSFKCYQRQLTIFIQIISLQTNKNGFRIKIIIETSHKRQNFYKKKKINQDKFTPANKRQNFDSTFWSKTKASSNVQNGSEKNTNI